ncbi:MAG: recombinase family protein [Pseudomonadota bacterium]
MIIGYCRSSTADQEAGLAGQEASLKEAGAEKVFREVASGTNANRVQLLHALDFVREGDTLLITKIDRLARSTADFLKIVDELEAKGVGLRVLDFGGREIDTKSPADRLIITLFAGFAQFERDLMRERQRVGIEAAKKAGKYKGRKPTARAKAAEVKALLAEGVKPIEVARRLEISRASVYRYAQSSSVNHL